MFLGIEIGGTKLQLGIGTGDGTIVAFERLRVDPAAGAPRIRQQIVQAAPHLIARAGLAPADIQAVGIGFGGPVNTDKGIVTKSHQVEGWSGFPLADWSRRELGWRAVLHNDADTAGLAEACFGAGRDLSPIFYITIGSGVGGGLIIDQRIYRGAGIGAAELGHLRVPKVDCDGIDFPVDESSVTVESLCSGWAIARRMRSTMERQIRHDREPQEVAVAEVLELAGGDLSKLTTETVALAARRGNMDALETLRAACRPLGWAVAQMITLLCPRRVVIGGGVSLIGDELLFEPLRAAVACYVFPPFAQCFDIVPSELGEAVVVHGALRLARDAS